MIQELLENRIYIVNQLNSRHYKHLFNLIETHSKRHLHFNHRCKDLQVLPLSLRIKPPVRTPKGWKLVENVGFQFLKLRNEETHKKICSRTPEKEFALDFLRSCLTTCDFKHLKTLVHEQQQEESGRIRSLHSKKLQALTSKSNVSSPDTVNRDKWVLDISSKPFNTTETIALQKGTNQENTKSGNCSCC